MIFQMEPNSGLDLGTRSVKGVVLKKNGVKIHLANCFLVDFARGRGNLPSVDDTFALAGAAIEANSWKNRWVGSIFDDKEIIIFELTLPKIPEAEILPAVENEVEQKLSFPIEDAQIDYTILSSTEKAIQVRIYCVKKSCVEKKVAQLKAYQLKPALLVSESLANIEMLKFNGYLDSPGFYIHIDFGESHTTTSLIQEGELVLSNSMPIGSGLVNQHLMNACSISYEEAEAIKLSHDFDAQASADAAIAKAIDDAYSEILIGVHKSIDYYRIRSKGNNLQNILLTGGGAAKLGLASIVESNFQVSTLVANPFKNIEIFSAKIPAENLQSISSQLCAAVGLALRGAA